MIDYLPILEKIAQNDPAGLRLLYDAYGSKFYTYAYRRWNLSEDDAWDVVYRTLEVLVLKLSGYRFESQSKFEGFMYTVLLNFVRQHYRSKRIREQTDVQFIGIDDEIGGYDVGKQINQAAFDEYYTSEVTESASMIHFKDCLQKLDDSERDLLLLRAQNYSYDEIAILLKIENRQLKVKCHRAKKKLIEILEKSSTNTASDE